MRFLPNERDSPKRELHGLLVNRFDETRSKFRVDGNRGRNHVLRDAPVP